MSGRGDFRRGKCSTGVGTLYADERGKGPQRLTDDHREVRPAVRIRQPLEDEKRH